MKAMLVIPHVSGGGGEKVLSDLACSLRCEIVIVVFEEKFSYPIRGKLISLNASIDRSSVVRRAMGFIHRAILFRRVVQAERPDVVLSFMGEANLINALISHHPILTVHTHMSSIEGTRNRIESSAAKALVRWLYKKAVVVAVSQEVKADLVEEFGVPERQVIVIPNAVDVAKVEALSHEDVECPWDAELPVIITAGRLTEVKAQWHLIRAFAQLRKSRPCQLAILGTGELETYLKGLARELGIEKDVFFLGWQSNTFKFLARADVFVLSSITESFGLALLEAMVCKLPVVAADSPGGVREIITGGAGGDCGVLVPPPDGRMYNGADPLTHEEQRLARELSCLLDDPEARKRYIHAGSLRVRDFDVASFVEKYQKLLEGRNSGSDRSDPKN